MTICADPCLDSPVALRKGLTAAKTACRAATYDPPRGSSASGHMSSSVPNANAAFSNCKDDAGSLAIARNGLMHCNRGGSDKLKERSQRCKNPKFTVGFEVPSMKVLPSLNQSLELTDIASRLALDGHHEF
jgi:hypothetical protein